MYSNEQLIRDYLSNLNINEIANSIHLIGINFERDNFDDIMSAIMSLYLDVAETAKAITNGFIKSNGENILANPDSRLSLVDEQEKKTNILNKLLDYQPIMVELSKKIQTESDYRIKQTY